MMRLLLITLTILFFASTAWAVMPDEKLADAALELRARAISQQLRCVVCQNETIDDSTAQIARDMRRVVRERLTAGDTDQAIIDYMVQRYGSFVLLKPQFSEGNYILWLAPFGLLLVCAAVLIVRKRRT